MDADDGEGGGDGMTRENTPSSGKVDKSQYNLFNPTPDNLLREFETSRPDQTTGPHTVDAGHFYLELGLFENSHQPRPDTHFELDSAAGHALPRGG